MIRLITSRAVELIGTQLLIFSCGTVLALIGHATFDLTAETAAQMVVFAQCAQLGFTVRGWM